jgi:hypothetical protein
LENVLALKGTTFSHLLTTGIMYLTVRGARECLGVGPNREKATRIWKKYINISPKSRKMSWTRQVALMGCISSAYKIVIVKSEGKSLLGSPRHRWKDY